MSMPEDGAERNYALTPHTMAAPPQVVLDEAAAAARALRAVIAHKPRKVVMNGEQYLEFEDWQTVGRFYGITVGAAIEPEFVRLGEAEGFRATSVALDSTGRELSRATAYCLSDEDKWGARPKYSWLYATVSGEWVEEDPGSKNIVWVDNPSKPGKKMPLKERRLVGEERVPLFQLASMAQTRANAKALRNVLSWVVVLAGYRATPAEELETITVEAEAAGEAVASATRGPTAAQKSDVPADLPVSGTKPSCTACGSDRTVVCSTAGVWSCSKAKGGCGAQLARIAK